MKIKCQFSGKIWKHYNPVDRWHFVSLPEEVSKEVGDSLQPT